MKLVEDIDCPHCKKPFTKETDLDKLDNVETTKTTNASVNTTQQILEKPEIKEKIVEKTVIEDFKPNYECPNGDCDVGVHKNKNYKKRPKGKCENCGQFTKHEKGVCPWCKGNEIEEVNPEDLDELGIMAPQIDEHEGHNHE